MSHARDDTVWLKRGRQRAAVARVLRNPTRNNMDIHQLIAAINAERRVTLSSALVLTKGAIQLRIVGVTNLPIRFYRVLKNW